MNSAPLKMLFLSADKFPPFRVDVTVLFGKEMVNKGHAIDWVLQSDKPLDRVLEKDYSGGTAFIGPASDGRTIVSRVKSLLWSVLHDFRIFPILKSRKYNVLIVKDKFISAFLAVFAARLFYVKFVYWLSFPFPEDSFFRVKEKTVKFPLLYWLRGLVFHVLVYKIVIPYSDHTFVQTEYMKGNIVKRGIPESKMTAVPMAVSIEDTPFYGHQSNENNPVKEPRIVYIGTLVKIRRMEFMLRVFKRVIEKEKNAKLYLVGGSEVPSDEEDLKMEAKRLGIDHAVTITGFLPQKEAWQFVKEAHVCVSPIYPSPSFDVGSPTKLLEYMAMGKASVANDHPEQKLILAESRAGICVPWSEPPFAEAIVHLINNQEEARQMGIRGRNYIEENRNYEMTSAFVEDKLKCIVG